jgi:hypothetical protein
VGVLTAGKIGKEVYLAARTKAEIKASLVA